MRSSRSAPDPLDPGPAGFAHRGLHDGTGLIENSLPAFAAAVDRGSGIECDLRLTADNQIIVFHDADAVRLCGSNAIIARSTLAELQGLTLGTGTIPTIGQLLALVDGRVPVLLEAKIDGRLLPFGAALRRELGSYRGRFGVMSFDARLPRWLRANAPHIRRGLVIAARLSPLRRWSAMKLADPDFVAVDRSALGQGWVGRVRQRLPVYSWTIRTAAERATAASHADALIWEADGRP